MYIIPYIIELNTLELNTYPERERDRERERCSIFTFNISISLHLFLITHSCQSKYISSYQHADMHVATFPHLLSLRVFKDKGHMIMCIFLYQLLTSNKALSVILSCCYLVLAANRNKAGPTDKGQ